MVTCNTMAFTTITCTAITSTTIASFLQSLTCSRHELGGQAQLAVRAKNSQRGDMSPALVGLFLPASQEARLYYVHIILNHPHFILSRHRCMRRTIGGGVNWPLHSLDSSSLRAQMVHITVSYHLMSFQVPMRAQDCLGSDVALALGRLLLHAVAFNIHVSCLQREASNTYILATLPSHITSSVKPQTLPSWRSYHFIPSHM